MGSMGNMTPKVHNPLSGGNSNTDDKDEVAGVPPKSERTTYPSCRVQTREEARLYQAKYLLYTCSNALQSYY